MLVEDEEPSDGDRGDEDDDEPINPLVDALFDEIETLREKVRHTARTMRDNILTSPIGM